MKGFSRRDDFYTREGQEIILVIYALRELRGINTKEEVLRFIRERKFYAIQPEDKVSYESKSEWKADTLLCWARKHAVMDPLGWMNHHDEKNSWEINRDGLRAIEEIFSRFRKKDLQVHRCFMWGPGFKQIVDPEYRPGSLDWPRVRTKQQRDIQRFAEQD